MTKWTDETQRRRITNHTVRGKTQVIFHPFVFLILALMIVACTSPPSTFAEITVQAALSTPTLEPTFTPSPHPFPTASEATQASLSGLILDQNNVPIAEARVRAGSVADITNADGSPRSMGATYVS